MGLEEKKGGMDSKIAKAEITESILGDFSCTINFLLSR
jgi:hypothetical protein